MKVVRSASPASDFLDRLTSVLHGLLGNRIGAALQVRLATKQPEKSSRRTEQRHQHPSGPQARGPVVIASASGDLRHD